MPYNICSLNVGGSACCFDRLIVIYFVTRKISSLVFFCQNLLNLFSIFRIFSLLCTSSRTSRTLFVVTRGTHSIFAVSLLSIALRYQSIFIDKMIYFGLPVPAYVLLIILKTLFSYYRSSNTNFVLVILTFVLLALTLRFLLFFLHE